MEQKSTTGLDPNSGLGISRTPFGFAWARSSCIVIKRSAIVSASRGPVAQLDRASVFGTEGCRFESCRGRQFPRIRTVFRLALQAPQTRVQGRRLPMADCQSSTGEPIRFLSVTLVTLIFSARIFMNEPHPAMCKPLNPALIAREISSHCSFPCLFPQTC